MEGEASMLLSPLTIVGLLWSLAVIWMLYFEKGRAFSSKSWVLLITAPLVFLTVPYVAGEVDVIRQLAGGVDPLDVHYAYASHHIVELAEGLGESGRWEYARFQLGADTLAPPAFAGFILNVTRVTVSFPRVRALLVVLISIYFFSVLAANTLMPLVMLNYPENSGVYALLYQLLPVLDFMKYSVHALAWLIIFSSYLGWTFLQLRQRIQGGDVKG